MTDNAAVNSPPRTVPTIDDVAAYLGVGRATVSRALRGKAEVSPATRERVVAAAQTLGYSASPSAARLAGGRTNAIAVVVPRVTRWFYSTVLEAIESAVDATDRDMLLINLAGKEAKRQSLFGVGSLSKRVDAVALVATPLTEEDVMRVSTWGIPGVIVSSGTPVPGWSSVRIDDARAAELAVQHLTDLGHKDIAHISGPLQHQLGSTTHLDRRHAFQEVVHAAGGRPTPIDEDPSVDFTIDGGIRATTHLLTAGQRPTAIFAACDEMAMGAMVALRASGLRVPEDVSVIGIDDHELSRAVGLTTVAQPAREQGKLAADILLNALNHPSINSEIHRTLDVDLITRTSTASPSH